MSNALREALAILRKFSSVEPEREWLAVSPEDVERYKSLLIRGDRHSVSLSDDNDWEQFLDLTGSGQPFADLHNHPDPRAPLPSIPDLSHFFSNNNFRSKPSKGTYGVLSNYGQGLTTINPTTDVYPVEEARYGMEELWRRALNDRPVLSVDGGLLPEHETALNMGILQHLNDKGTAKVTTSGTATKTIDPMFARDLWNRIGGKSMMDQYRSGGYVDGE